MFRFAFGPFKVQRRILFNSSMYSMMQITESEEICGNIEEIGSEAALSAIKENKEMNQMSMIREYVRKGQILQVAELLKSALPCRWFLIDLYLFQTDCNRRFSNSQRLCLHIFHGRIFRISLFYTKKILFFVRHTIPQII